MGATVGATSVDFHGFPAIDGLGKRVRDLLNRKLSDLDERLMAMKAFRRLLARQLAACGRTQRTWRFGLLSGVASQEREGLAPIAFEMDMTTQRVAFENSGRSKRTIAASLAALGSVILASSCCLPLLPFLFAARTAGTSAFFVKMRPFLLAASVLLIGFGFYHGGGPDNATVNRIS